MIKTLSTNTVNPSLIALKPRQILLAESNMSHIKKEKKKNDDDSRLADKTLIVSLKEDQKALLLHSIAHYLQRNGFSKAFKKFCSEAQIEKDNLNGASLALEEMYCKYLEMCDNAGKSCKSFNSLKEQGIGEADSVADVENVGKKEKKTSQYCDGNAVVNQSGAVDKFTNSKNMLSNDAVPEMKVKSKDKKKSKKILETPGQGAEQVTSEALKDPAHNTVCEIQLDEPDKSCKDNKKKKIKLVSGIHVDAVGNYQEMLSEGKIVNDSESQNKSKDRKKKKTKPTSETLVDNAEQCSFGDKQGARTINLKDMGCAKDSQGGISEELDIGNSNRIDSLKEDFKTLGEDAPKKEIKDSKKRKRLASKENNSQLVDSKEIEESKTEGSEESKGSKKQKVNASIGSGEHSGKESKVESGEVGLDDSQMALIKQVDGQGNGSLERSVEKSSMKKSMKKQNNGSVEPKTVNAFQRVKVDDVVFTDERLQDNSYWAKDGADAGYGAKAQEILGQVRGRDFRHEKTKKKRGTYRGGLIDLQSHSIKFNYSDDE